MNDTLKDTGFALLGLALFAGILKDRVEHSARRDLRAALPGGQIDVRVESRGLFGMAIGQAYRGLIYGGGFKTDRLPFHLEPGGGVLANVRHLELDLHDIVLHDLPVQSLKADIPFVKADGMRVFLSGHLTLRGAGEGSGVAVISEAGLTEFLSKKRPLFQDLKIRLTPGQAYVTASARFLAAPTPIQAYSGVGIAEGRYLNAVDARILLSGKEVAPEMTATLLKSLNPIIDVDRDLRLGDWLYITGAEIGDGILIIRGKVTIPRIAAPKEERH